jgi:hypothetical protein
MRPWLLQGGIMTACGLLFGLFLRGVASRGLHTPYRGFSLKTVLQMTIIMTWERPSCLWRTRRRGGLYAWARLAARAQLWGGCGGAVDDGRRRLSAHLSCQHTWHRQSLANCAGLVANPRRCATMPGSQVLQITRVGAARTPPHAGRSMYGHGQAGAIPRAADPAPYRLTAERASLSAQERIGLRLLLACSTRHPLIARLSSPRSGCVEHPALSRATCGTRLSRPLGQSQSAAPRASHAGTSGKRHRSRVALRLSAASISFDCGASVGGRSSFCPMLEA